MEISSKCFKIVETILVVFVTLGSDEHLLPFKAHAIFHTHSSCGQKTLLSHLKADKVNLALLEISTALSLLSCERKTFATIFLSHFSLNFLLPTILNEVA